MKGKGFVPEPVFDGSLAALARQQGLWSVSIISVLELMNEQSLKKNHSIQGGNGNVVKTRAEMTSDLHKL